MQINIVCSDGGRIPTKATEGAAAFDVRLPRETYVNPGRNVLPLNFSMEIPMGYEAKIEPKSGMSVLGMIDIYGRRHDADVIQGKIDPDYRGNVGVIVVSREAEPFLIGEGTKVAQMTIYKTEDVVFTNADSLSETERGNGGFGSTGTK